MPARPSSPATQQASGPKLWLSTCLEADARAATSSATAAGNAARGVGAANYLEKNLRILQIADWDLAEVSHWLNQREKYQAAEQVIETLVRNLAGWARKMQQPGSRTSAPAPNGIENSSGATEETAYGRGLVDDARSDDPAPGTVTSKTAAGPKKAAAPEQPAVSQMTARQLRDLARTAGARLCALRAAILEQEKTMLDDLVRRSVLLAAYAPASAKSTLNSTSEQELIEILVGEVPALDRVGNELSWRTAVSRLHSSLKRCQARPWAPTGPEPTDDSWAQDELRSLVDRSSNAFITLDSLISQANLTLWAARDSLSLGSRACLRRSREWAVALLQHLDKLPTKLKLDEGRVQWPDQGAVFEWMALNLTPLEQLLSWMAAATPTLPPPLPVDAAANVPQLLEAADADMQSALGAAQDAVSNAEIAAQQAKRAGIASSQSQTTWLVQRVDRLAADVAQQGPVVERTAQGLEAARDAIADASPALVVPIDWDGQPAPEAYGPRQADYDWTVGNLRSLTRSLFTAMVPIPPAIENVAKSANSAAHSADAAGWASLMCLDPSLGGCPIELFDPRKIRCPEAREILRRMDSSKDPLRFASPPPIR